MSARVALFAALDRLALLVIGKFERSAHFLPARHGPRPAFAGAFPPSWNVAPTDTLPVVRFDAKVHQRSLDMLRWGLIPYWAKGIKVGFATINAKAEGIESKPAFRKAFERRRCLVPADNFYEWKKTATGKQPYVLALADRGIMALAGVWENWQSPAGEWVRSFAIITTTPNELCGEIHNRMPVILKPDAWLAWLGEEPAEVAELKSLLAPYPSDEMICWPVSPRVGSVKNNDASLIEPLPEMAHQTGIDTVPIWREPQRRKPLCRYGSGRN
jgi:putative SOS response-associated peptidase YedK